MFLFSLKKVVDAQGKNYNYGELFRWLSESGWFPTNLLPSNYLYWTAIDERNAKLSFQYNNLELFFVVSFKDVGETE